MNNQADNSPAPGPTEKADIFLDITEAVCPMTFVRTKLLIESMDPGQVAEVRLRGAEPLKNVPRSIKGYGHTVLKLEPEETDPGPLTPYRLWLRKEEHV
jgi:TusA-related sulfurtransferase